MDSYVEMCSILHYIQADRNVQRMKQYVQHGSVSTYEHCESVAKLCYILNRRLAIHANLRVLLIGAKLHDFYLYDWHKEDNGEHHMHGFIHAKIARQNAQKYLGVDDRTLDVIYCHMWPLNIERIPRSREAWLVCIADKLVSVHETLFRRKNRNL